MVDGKKIEKKGRRAEKDSENTRNINAKKDKRRRKMNNSKRNILEKWREIGVLEHVFGSFGYITKCREIQTNERGYRNMIRGGYR